MKTWRPLLVLFVLLNSFFQQGRTQEWAWLKNHSLPSAPGIYGTQGISSPLNTPGSRDHGASWYYNNALYIFGGYGWDANTDEGYLNDLWKFDLATGNWTWIKGSATRNITGTLKTMGIESSTATPGSRSDCISWIYNGELYLFGGNGYDKNGLQGALNDTWKYNPVTNNWTWLNGNGELNEAAVHGTINIPAVTNTPGGRIASTGWNPGNKVYLYGGSVAQSKVEGASTDKYGDVWEFDIDNLTWTWIKGSDQPNPASFHGAQGEALAANEPGTRSAAIPGVLQGKLYMLGGSGIYMGIGGIFNDLWQFDPLTKMWTWVKGEDGIDINGIYGQLNTATAAGKPGSRSATRMWTHNNELYLFGGYGNGETASGWLSDLWKYNAGTNNWTWIGGTGEIDLQSQYGAQGHFGANNTPSGRATTFIISQLADIYVFGGTGISDDPQSGAVSLNDLWHLNLGQTGGNSIIENFRAKKIRDSHIELTWHVASSSGIASFIVEHGADSLNLVPVGSVASDGGTSYSFDHLNPLFLKNYYRIKIIFNDQTVAYSQVLVINVGNSSFVHILQNPVYSTLTFKCDNIAGRSVVQVINMNGNVMIEKIMLINPDIKSINVSQLSPGLYSLVVTLYGLPTSEMFLKN